MIGAYTYRLISALAILEGTPSPRGRMRQPLLFPQPGSCSASRVTCPGR